MERIVLAYSGGLETSVAIPWLKERHGAEIITVTMDLGQGEELEAVRNRALAAGAVRAHVLDVREEFAGDYVVPTLKAGAIHEDRSPMATALGRPLIARKLVEIAAIERAAAVAHGCTGTANDQARLDLATRALDPTLRVLAPARESGLTRLEQMAYARARGISMPVSAGSPYGTHSNLWGRSIACGAPEDAWRDPPEELYTLTKAPGDCPDEPAYVEIAFERGAPAAINGVAMPILELIASLGVIAGAHGLGRIRVGENRVVAGESCEACEAPAAVVLHAAHRELQKLVTSGELDRVCRGVSLEYAEIVHKGMWFTPMREALYAFVDKVQERVTGAVQLKLFKGDCRVVARKSPCAVADLELGSDDGGDTPGQVTTAASVTADGLPTKPTSRQASEEQAVANRRPGVAASRR